MNTAKRMGMLILASTFLIGPLPAAAQGLTTTQSASHDYLATNQGAPYWTAERVRNAKPMPWYDRAADTAAFEGLSSLDIQLGPAGSAPGGGPQQAPGNAASAPEASAALDAQTGLSAEEADESDNGVDFGTADVGDNDFVNQDKTLWKKYPWKAVGKLLISTPGGGSGWCTASVISPNDVIVTAAHCCYDRGAGQWNSNFAFVPAMRIAARPYKTFPYTAATILTAWITQGGRENDVCVLNLGKSSSNKRVTQVTGWLGRSWNQPIVQHHFSYGYPSNISSGDYKYECSAESYANCGSGLVVAMGCNMTFGSSGGPWIHTFKKYQAGAMNYVNSVVSGYDECTGTFGQSFNGARFTSGNIVPVCNAAGC